MPKYLVWVETKPYLRLCCAVTLGVRKNTYRDKPPIVRPRRPTPLRKKPTQTKPKWSCIWLKAGAWLAIIPPFPWPVSGAVVPGSVSSFTLHLTLAPCQQLSRKRPPQPQPKLCPPVKSFQHSCCSQRGWRHRKGWGGAINHRPVQPQAAPFRYREHSLVYTLGVWAGLGMGVNLWWLWASVKFHCLPHLFLQFWCFFFFFFQTFYSVHILLVQQKSGHVVVFLVGSGACVPRNLVIKATWIWEYRTTEPLNMPWNRQ